MATQIQIAPAYVSPQGSGVSHRPTSHHGLQKKPWQTRRRSPLKSNISSGPDQEEERVSRETSRRTTRSTKRTPKWWKIRLFRGMIEDVKRRAPYYWSDWTDAWDYRVIPATVYMYFAKYDTMSSLLSTSTAYHSSCNQHQYCQYVIERQAPKHLTVKLCFEVTALLTHTTVFFQRLPSP